MKGMAFATLATLALTILVMTIVIILVVTQFVSTGRELDDIHDTVNNSISSADQVQAFSLCAAQGGTCQETCENIITPNPCPTGYYCCAT